MTKLIISCIKTWVKYIITRLLSIILTPVILVRPTFLKNKISWAKYFFANRLNLIQTIRINLFEIDLPLCDRVKLPIYVYKNIKLYNLGTIRVEGDIYSGMIHVNSINWRAMNPTKIENHGVIIFRRGVRLFEGVTIIVKKGALLEIGKNVSLCENTLYYAEEKIAIGDSTDIAYNSQIFDSNSHFTIDINTRKTSVYSKPVIIGERNWIGNNTTIKPGTITNPDTIVAASYSVLTKDYREVAPRFSILAGNPAKLLKEDVARIRDLNLESELYNHRNDNPRYIPNLEGKDLMDLIVTDGNYI